MITFLGYQVEAQIDQQAWATRFEATTDEQ